MPPSTSTPDPGTPDSGTPDPSTLDSATPRTDTSGGSPAGLLLDADTSPRRQWRRIMAACWPTAWGLTSWTSIAHWAHMGGGRGWTAAIAMTLGTIVLVAAVTLLFDGVRRHGGVIPERLRRGAWLLLGTGLALMLVVLVTGGSSGLLLLGFAAAAVGLGLPWRQSVPIVLVGAAALYAALSLAGIGTNDHTGTLLGLLAAGLGSALGRFSAERDRTAKVMARHAHELEISDERNRMARDLHDILGHSLTVIAMKTELAEMLLDADPERARTELREVQSLTRSALADVRATVNNYRELSLAGEIARAGVTLRTAGVRAELPATIDEVDPAFRELFAWALRESVTNIVRHANAHTCVVTLGPTSLRVDDDGVGPAHGRAGADDGASDGDGGSDATGGNGLIGLRQRAQAVGAVVETPPSRLATGGRPGFCLLVRKDAA